MTLRIGQLPPSSVITVLVPLIVVLQTASTDTPGAILFHSTKSATMSSTALIVVYLAKDTGDA